MPFNLAIDTGEENLSFPILSQRCHFLLSWSKKDTVLAPVSVTQRFPFSSSAMPKGLVKDSASLFAPKIQRRAREGRETLTPRSRGPRMLFTYKILGESGGD